MHRFSVRWLAVLTIAVFSALPLSAAPKRDDRQPTSFLERVAKIVKRLLPLEDIQPQWPKP